MLPYRVETIQWEVFYPVHREPIGRIRRRAGAYEAMPEDKHLGAFLSGDAAVDAS